jgi:outer membrane receptor protein involved in Fe transport
MWFKLSYMHALVEDQWFFPMNNPGYGKTVVYQPAFGQTWVLSPTLTFDTTLGISDSTVNGRNPDFPMGEVGLDVLGIPGTNSQGRTDIPRAHLYAGIPNIATGFQTVGDIANFWPADRDEFTLSLTNNLTKFMGKHEIRGGYTWFRGTLNHWQPERQNPRGSFVVATNATRMANIPNVQTSTNFYNQHASFMFGLVRNVGKSVQNEIFSVYEQTHAFFVRDRWNATQKLTLDLGVRYELYPVMRRANRGMEMLDLDTLEIVIGGRGPDNPATVFDESSETLGVAAQKDLIAPRAGIIYRLDDKTVMRAGYGLAFSGEGFTRPFPFLNPCLGDKTHPW